MEWEKIDDWNERASVPGGWIVKTLEPVFHLENSMSQGGDGWDWRIATCFVPDPTGEWVTKGNDTE